MKIKFDNTLAGFTVFAALATVVVLYVLYGWWVMAYGYNLTIAKMFGVSTINLWQAGGLSTLVGMFFFDMRIKLTKLVEKTNWVSGGVYLVLTHVMLWLLVG